jgi:hypothetical protein
VVYQVLFPVLGLLLLVLGWPLAARRVRRNRWYGLRVPATFARRVTVDHPVFGRLPLADLLHFLLIHTNHHRPQLSAGAV